IDELKRSGHRTHGAHLRSLRNPVKVDTHSTVNVISDSTLSDQGSERSDAGDGFMSRGDQYG
ncbi:MAG: hypothetical protein OXU81_04985, partial [Gammaproteobacteria bacterium]|nr:hypothetical protein [Gammaproteobacteria bacterium]